MSLSAITPAMIFFWGLGLAQVLLAASMVLSTWRIWRGPRAQDRVLGVDSLYLNAMLLIIVHGMRMNLSAYFETALIMAIIGFTSTVALAKFLMRGEVIE